MRGRQCFQYNIHNWNPKDCHDGTGNHYWIVLCFLKPSAIQLRFVFEPQILGAFADHDGVPMQGMKIKNVVPGKITYIFIAPFGAVEQLHVPRNFAFSNKRYSQTFSSVAFVACLCKRSV